MHLKIKQLTKIIFFLISKDEESGKIDAPTEKENKTSAGKKEISEDVKGDHQYGDREGTVEVSVNLYDTPVMENVRAHFKSEQKGFHAIGLVFPLTRYTEERKEFVEQVQNAFVPNLSDHIIIIFTQTEEERGLEEIKEQIKMTGDKVLDDLVKKSGDRCIILGKPAETEEKKEKLKKEFTDKLKDVLDTTKRNGIFMITNSKSKKRKHKCNCCCNIKRCKIL
jgi:GTPase SAR1 family protein